MDIQMERPTLRRVNVGTTERRVSLATGFAMLSYLVRKRPNVMVGLPLGLEAGYLLYRGATGHCVIYQMMDIDRSEDGHQGIKVERAVTVNRPRDELFRIWRNFENLPRFMTHLQRVAVDELGDDKRSHWVAKAPLGREIEWDSEITEERENEYIVKVSMQYHPPAGSMGAAVAKLFGEEPDQQVREDLRHFKQIMETGEIPSVEGQPSGRNTDFDQSIAERGRDRDLVEEASAQSFPASDPPAWISGKSQRRPA